MKSYLENFHLNSKFEASQSGHQLDSDKTTISCIGPNSAVTRTVVCSFCCRISSLIFTLYNFANRFFFFLNPDVWPTVARLYIPSLASTLPRVLTSSLGDHHPLGNHCLGFFPFQTKISNDAIMLSQALLQGK